MTFQVSCESVDKVHPEDIGCNNANSRQSPEPTDDNDECATSKSESRSSDEEDSPLISPGTVVWAKMTGYPWWPGVVMPEPNSTRFYQAWKRLYHVLFFDRGTQLQRGWVSAARVEALDEEEVGHGWSGPRPAKMPPKKSKHFADVESALVWVGRVRGMSDEQRKSFFLPYVG